MDGFHGFVDENFKLTCLLTKCSARMMGPLDVVQYGHMSHACIHSLTQLLL